jgi:hypothetical protein
MAELHKLAKAFYEHNLYEVHEKPKLKGKNGKEHKLDFLVKREELFHTEQIGVLCVDGFISRDTVERFAKDIEALDLDRGAIFGKNYTAKVHKYATDIKIDLATEEKLQRKLKQAGSRGLPQKIDVPKVPILFSIPPLKIKDMFFRKIREVGIIDTAIELRSTELMLTPYWLIDYRAYKKWIKGKKEEEIEENGTIAVNGIAARESVIPGEVFDKKPIDPEDFQHLLENAVIEIDERLVTEESAKTYVKQLFADRYTISKSDVTTSEERAVFLPRTWRLIYAFRGKTYNVVIDGIRGIIEKFEVPELTEKEAERLAKKYIQERYAVIDVAPEEVLLEENTWHVKFSSKDQEYHVELGNNSAYILKSTIGLLRKRVIQLAQEAVKDKFEEGKLELEKTDKKTYEWIIQLSTPERVYTVKIDNSTGDIRDISYIYSKDEMFSFVNDHLKESYEVKDAELQKADLDGDVWSFAINSSEGQFVVTANRVSGKVLDVSVLMSDKRARTIAERYLAKEYSEFNPKFLRTTTGLLSKNTFILDYLSGDKTHLYAVKIDKKTGEIKNLDKSEAKPGKGVLKKLAKAKKGILR